MQLQLLDLEVLAVERADDSGQVGLTGAKPHRDAALGAARVAEAGEDRLEPLAVVGVGGNRLDRRTADARLQLVGRPLGHDLAVVDDPDAVGEDVGLLEVLGRQEDGDAVLARQSLDLLPECGAALDVQAGGRLVEEEDPRGVDERQRQVEPALHSAGVALHLAVRRLREPNAPEQLVGALAANVAR